MPTVQFDSAALTKKIQITVAETVAHTMRDIFADPEFLCDLQPWVKKRLTKKPKTTLSLKEVKDQLRLNRQ